MELMSIFLTLLASSILAALVTYKVNESQDRRWFMGRKAEELYCSVEALDRELSKYFGSQYAFGAIEGQDAKLEVRTEGSGLSAVGAELVNAKMLIGFYFQSLTPVLARTIAAVTTAVNSLEQWKKLAASERDIQLVRLDTDVAALKDSLEAFKSAVIIAGRPANIRSGFTMLRRAGAPQGGRVLRVAT